MAESTLTCNRRSAAAGIAQETGGQADELASARLNAMNRRSRAGVPWAVGFGRAIQQPALEIWHGEDANVTAAQEALRHRARSDQMARRGAYSAAGERTAA
jgi:fructose-bisphosphate aldolase class I